MSLTASPTHAAPPDVTKQSCDAQGGTYSSSRGTKSCTTTHTTVSECYTWERSELDETGSQFERRTFGTCTYTYTTTTTMSQKVKSAPTATSSTEEEFEPNGQSECWYLGTGGHIQVDDSACDAAGI